MLQVQGVWTQVLCLPKSEDQKAIAYTGALSSIPSKSSASPAANWDTKLPCALRRRTRSDIRAVSTVGRSLDRTGRVLGLLLSNPCLLKTILLLYPLTSMTFTLLALIFLSKKIVPVDFGPNQSSDHHEY